MCLVEIVKVYKMTKTTKLTIAAALALGFIIGCNNTELNNNHYPQSMKDNFMSKCDFPSQDCECQYSSLEKKYSMEEFIEIDKSLGTGKYSSPELKREIQLILLNCSSLFNQSDADE